MTSVHSTPLLPLHTHTSLPLHVSQPAGPSTSSSCRISIHLSKHTLDEISWCCPWGSFSWGSCSLFWAPTAFFYKYFMNRVPWTARRSNQSILKEISPGYSLEGLMLKLKLQYFGRLMQRADSFEKTLPDVGKDWRQEEKGMTDDEMVG